MKTLEEIKQWLVQNKSLLRERYKVRELGVFGSYVRQEQTETSDVDILVEFFETPSLLKFLNLENYLSDNLGGYSQCCCCDRTVYDRHQL
jgi:hypothetical protein